MPSSANISQMLAPLVPATFVAAAAFWYLLPVIRCDRRTIIKSCGWHPLIFIFAALLSVILSPLTGTANRLVNPQFAMDVVNLLFVVGGVGAFIALFTYPGAKSTHLFQLFQIPVVVWLWVFCMLAITHEGI